MATTPDVQPRHHAHGSLQLKRSLDRYSLAMQEYKALFNQIPYQHRPEALPPLESTQDITSLEKRIEFVRARRWRLERLLVYLQQKHHAEANTKLLSQTPPHLRGLQPTCTTPRHDVRDRLRADNQVSSATSSLVADLPPGAQRPESRPFEGAHLDCCGEVPSLDPAQAQNIPAMVSETFYSGHQGHHQCQVHGAPLLSEADVYLIMALWELHPAIAPQLSRAVRTFRAEGLTFAALKAGMWSSISCCNMEPDHVEVILRQMEVMRDITNEIEIELAVPYLSRRRCRNN